MAQQTIVQLIDDIDGSEAEYSIEFGLDGVSYQIDLNAPHAAELQQVFKEYVAAARRVKASPDKPRSRPRARAGATAGATAPVEVQAPVPAEVPYRERTGRRLYLSKVRDWALANGHVVGGRGRISKEILAEYARLNG